MSIHVSDSLFEVGLLKLASNIPNEEFTEFLQFASKCNRIGYLEDFLSMYTGMLDDGCDPASAMCFAYFDVLEEYDKETNQQNN